MTAAWYAAVAALAVGVGALGTVCLTTHPLRMGRHLLAWSAALFGLGLALAFAPAPGHRWIGLGVAAALALVAYLLTAVRILSRDDPRPLPPITRVPGEPGAGHTAVVYFTHGEPETYDPIGWINQFREFDRQKIRFVPLVARPIFLQRLRTGYLRIGRSEHRRTHLRMLAALEQSFRERGDSTTRFYLCFLDDRPRPEAAVIQALNEGADRIIVAEVFLTVSNHTAEGKELIDALDVENRFGVPVVYSGPLHDSLTLRRMFVERTEQAADGLDRSRVGVLLVGHGQPDDWDQRWPTETEQEMSFRRGVLIALEEAGFSPENLSLAWMEFKQPRPAEKAEELAARGVQRILYFSAAISADSMHSQYDTPQLLARARLPREVALVNLGAWNDHPLAIQAIREKVDPCLAR